MISLYFGWILFGLFVLSLLFLIISIFVLLIRAPYKRNGKTTAKRNGKTAAALEKTVQAAAQNASCVGSCSVIGDRPTQQDHCLVDEDLPQGGKMAIVCDGMGGMENGGEASRLCVRHFADECKRGWTDVPSFLRGEAQRLNDAVNELCDQAGRPVDSGTTLVAVVLYNDHVHWVHVGDSRIYLWRGGRIYRLTTDHNYALQLREEVAQGRRSAQQAAQEGRQEALISYIGIEKLARVDVGGNFPTYPGDIFMLCSDGVTKALRDDQLQQFFEQNTDTNAGAIARSLIQVAMQNKRPKQDNTTVAIITC